MTELTLRWEKFGLSRGLQEMLATGELVDVTLACQGEVIQAHKTALAACSPHFKHLFTVNPCQHPIVFMQDVNLDHLRALLQFMYTGEATVHQQELPGFLRTAEALQVSGLTPRTQDEEAPAAGTEETAPPVAEMSRQARPSKRPRSRAPASKSPSVEKASSPLPGRSTDESSVGVLEAPQPLMLEPEEIKVESEDETPWMESDNTSAEPTLQTLSEENVWHAGSTEHTDSREVKRVKRNNKESTSRRLLHKSMSDTSSPTCPAISKPRKQTERPLVYPSVSEQEPGSSGLGALGNTNSGAGMSNSGAPMNVTSKPESAIKVTSKPGASMKVTSNPECMDARGHVTTTAPVIPRIPPDTHIRRVAPPSVSPAEKANTHKAAEVANKASTSPDLPRVPSDTRIVRVPPRIPTQVLAVTNNAANVVTPSNSHRITPEIPLNYNAPPNGLDLSKKTTSKSSDANVSSHGQRVVHSSNAETTKVAPQRTSRLVSSDSESAGEKLAPGFRNTRVFSTGNEVSTERVLPQPFTVGDTELVRNLESADNSVVSSGSNEPVECSFCKKMYKNRQTLKTHIHLYHTGKGVGRQHTCALCGKSYKLRQNLLEHEKKNHNTIFIK